MFGGFKTIKQLILPDNIKAIGPHSLFGCEILLSIHIPEGVKKIDGQAFQLCQLLSSVDLPVGLETIGFHALQIVGIFPKSRYPRLYALWNLAHLTTVSNSEKFILNLCLLL